jgi:hypothetical protein
MLLPAEVTSIAAGPYVALAVDGPRPRSESRDSDASSGEDGDTVRTALLGVGSTVEASPMGAGLAGTPLQPRPLLRSWSSTLRVGSASCVGSEL